MLSPTPWPSPTWFPLDSASLRVSKIASFGHSGRQAPQEIHSSVINSAMTLAPPSRTMKTNTIDKPATPRHSGQQLERHFILRLFSKSTERHRLRRPRAIVIMGLWAQFALTKNVRRSESLHDGDGPK